MPENVLVWGTELLREGKDGNNALLNFVNRLIIYMYTFSVCSEESVVSGRWIVAAANKESRTASTKYNFSVIICACFYVPQWLCYQRKNYEKSLFVE